MNKDLLWSLCPNEYLKRFIEQGIRPDGRTSEISRNICIQKNTIPNYDCSVSIKAGSSSYMAGSTNKIAINESDSDIQRRIIVNIDFPKVCGVTVSTNQSIYIANTIMECLNDTRILNKGLLSSKVNDKDIFWVIYIDIVCLSYDGNALDYCFLAAVASLIDTNIPKNIEWDKEYSWYRISSDNILLEPSGNICNEDTNVQEDSSNRILKYIPIFVSFLYLSGGYWVCDPSHIEDSQGDIISFCCLGIEEKVTLVTQRITKCDTCLQSNLSHLKKVAIQHALNIRRLLI
ncbi:3 exoribonuclease family protein [Cryptosporidium andersoni]|uniref:Ribosomal RNA-processing protein 43 n=1 Tax=Cryptosporidium andersoni TaxID=117008 RepID=A0A1J4MK76_9CRYT|nr:3 exoribonuclease family protein [Cryptosporidium andersoni]